MLGLLFDSFIIYLKLFQFHNVLLKLLLHLAVSFLLKLYS